MHVKAVFRSRGGLSIFGSKAEDMYANKCMQTNNVW
jgi:hypothetical protein